MGDYLTLIVSVSLFSALINALLGEKGVGKTARSVVSVVILLVVTLPIIKSLVSFGNNIAIPVIKEEESHIIDTEETDTHKEWLAKVTAEEVSQEITTAVKTYTGFTVRVECPWHIEEGNVVFDVIRVYTNSDERYHEKIRNCIKLHYALDSVCIKE